MPYFPTTTQYSEKYTDSQFEFRHVTLSQKDFEALPKVYREYYACGNKQRQSTEDDFLALQMQEISQGNPGGTTESM